MFDTLYIEVEVPKCDITPTFPAQTVFVLNGILLTCATNYKWTKPNNLKSKLKADT